MKNERMYEILDNVIEYVISNNDTEEALYILFEMSFTVKELTGNFWDAAEEKQLEEIYEKWIEKTKNEMENSFIQYGTSPLTTEIVKKYLRQELYKTLDNEKE